MPTFTGGKKYEIKGCAGTGGFAQVYKSYLDSNPDDVVALKVKFSLIDKQSAYVLYFQHSSYVIPECELVGYRDSLQMLVRYKHLLFLGNSTCIVNLINVLPQRKYVVALYIFSKHILRFNVSNSIYTHPRSLIMSEIKFWLCS